MAVVYKDRVRDTTTTTGTGTVTLSGTPPTGYQAFSTVGDGNECFYLIESSNSSEWEVGRGVYTASGTTLSRASILASSNSGAAVNFSAGTKSCYLVTSSQGFAGRNTIWVPAAAMTARTTNGAARGTAEMTTNKNMLATLDFDASTQEFAQFEVGFEKGWNRSTVAFQPVWSHASTTTNFGVVFALAGVATSNDDALDVAFGTAQTSTDTGGTTNDRYVGPESSAITIAGSPAAGDVVQFQIARNVSDGSDTMAIDARLHGVWVFYDINAATDD
jgi:hypothetical protein